MSEPAAYPDISDILERKRRGREQLAGLSFAEKLEILEAMRERADAIRRMRSKVARAERDTGSRGKAIPSSRA